MILLIIGIAIWWAAHLYKRVAPAQRAAMTESMGPAFKGIVAALLVLSVVLMVIGYRAADFVAVYDTPSWTRHLNNLLMLIAVALFGLGSSKSRLRARMRHPMLLGMLTWAVAHLMVNGDLASILLFGLLGLWAIVEIIAINRAEPIWTPWQGGSVAGDVRLAVISVAVFGVIALVHTWLGYPPFSS